MARTMVDCKLVFLGDTSVGKSCIVGRFVRDEFLEYQESTIGAAFVTRQVQLPDVTVKFEIWDTAGQERYRSLAPMYYRGAAAAVVVYDVTNKETYDGPNGAKTWVKELQRRGDGDVTIALAGNKVDMKKHRQVDAEEAQEYATSENLLFFETSARDGTNIQAMFQSIAKTLKKVPSAAKAAEDAVGLGSAAPPAESKGCCR